MSKEFAIADVLPGKLNALVKNIMRQTGEVDPNKAVRLVNSGEWVVSKPPCSWAEKDGVMRFSVISDGTNGKDWVTRLRSKRFAVSDLAEKVLLSPDFKPTSGVTTEVAVLRGTLFEEDDSRTTSEIFAEAERRKLLRPNAEVACLIREKFADNEVRRAAGSMWGIVVMHEPINDFAGDPYLLTVDCLHVSRYLIVYSGKPVDKWGRASGFAFAVSQVGSQP